ncbi:MAG TPA: class I SAM-dependent methyltransferase [Verrucomicrobiae bacterium]|jgi:ubiquinone/menaquinone biosynthesis C-methylase UbiE|nr:class I SAM-dependent methyltransferase [Verrucomicrobiae bacterium]
MSFDLLAPHYRWIEFVSAGEQLQQCRTALLERVLKSKKVLIFGEGNGRFLAECGRQLPDAKITVVDASARMLALAQRRLAGQGTSSTGIDFICADALTWTPPAREFDLIVTHFFLDCFRREQVEMLIGKLAQAAAPRANWLLADFQVPASGLARQRSRLILWMLYRFFRVTTGLPGSVLTPPDDFLRQNGFALRERRLYDWELLHSDWWRLPD